MRSRKRPLPGDLGLSAEEGRTLAALRTPQRVQEFVAGLRANFEQDGDTLRSVRGVLRHRKAHCIEAAFVAACALWLHGEPPLLMDLTAAKGDSDHVVALFRRNGCWGAISKSNHAWLRWRDPVYRSLRELAMSYFHEYFLNDGTKTMRKFSKPFDLSKVKVDWRRSKEDLPDLVDTLDSSPHENVLPKGHRLRKAEKIETRAGLLVEWEK